MLPSSGPNDKPRKQQVGSLIADGCLLSRLTL
jgi:hypothetical protein